MGSACSSDTVVDKAGCDGHEHGRAAQKPQSRSEQYQQPHTPRNYWHWTSASNTATPRGRRDGHGSAPTTPSDLPISADTFDAPPMFIDRGYVKPKAGGSSGRGATSIHDFVVRTRDGTGFDLARCRGGPALVVNVAGRCDLAQSSFEAMAELHDRFARAGLAVLAFPCDQFGHHGQRGPGGAAGAQQSVAEATRVAREDDQLAAHVARVYLARFPVFARVDVTGADTEPLFRYLVDHAPEGALGAGLTYPGVTWNFTAFLCDGAGRVVRRYEPGVSVAEVEADLAPLLQAARQAEDERLRQSLRLSRSGIGRRLHGSSTSHSISSPRGCNGGGSFRVPDLSPRSPRYRARRSNSVSGRRESATAFTSSGTTTFVSPSSPGASLCAFPSCVTPFVPLGRSAVASPTLPRESAPTFVATEPPLINLIDEVNAQDY